MMAVAWGGLYVEMAVDDRSFRIDQNGPGRSTGAVLAHNSSNFKGLGIPGGVGHGDIQNHSSWFLCSYLTSGRPSAIQRLIPDDR